MKPPSKQPVPTPRGSSPFERLFVAWLLSTVLLVALLAVLTILGVGHLRRHAEALNRQQAQLDELVRRLPAVDAGAPRAPAPSPRRRPDRVERPPTTAASQPAPRPTLDPATVAAEFDALVGDEPARAASVFLRVRDRNRAVALLTRADDPAELGAAAIAKLNLLAHVIGDEDRAAAYAQAAASAEPAAVDDEIATRLGFEAGQLADAFAHAILWASSGDPPPPAALLILAICAVEQGDFGAAVDAIDSISPTIRLDAASLAAVGETCIATEAWKPLEAWISAAEPAVRSSPAAQRLLATTLLHTRRATEALAVVAALLDAAPDDPDLLILRAAGLTEARQFDAAKATLARISIVPIPAAAAYWRGVIEMRTGAPAEARKWFGTAVGTARQSAPAWEGLAQLDIAAADAAGSGDVATARRALAAAEKNLAAAINANPRRPSGHFLLAIVHAKSSRGLETRTALRTALHLDPAIAGEARKVPAIVRLVPADEIDQLAAETN